MSNEIKPYLVKAFALLVKAGKREIENLPLEYKIVVAEYLAQQVEN